MTFSRKGKDGYGCYFTVCVRCRMSWEHGQTHYPFSILCMLRVIFSPSSLLSQLLFSRRALLFSCLLGSVCYRTFSQTRALTIPRPLRAFCLSRGTVHNGVYEGAQLFWSHSSRKSMEEGFLFSEEGGSRGENSDIFQVNSFQLENFMLPSPIQ